MKKLTGTVERIGSEIERRGEREKWICRTYLHHVIKEDISTKVNTNYPPVTTDKNYLLLLQQTRTIFLLQQTRTIFLLQQTRTIFLLQQTRTILLLQQTRTLVLPVKQTRQRTFPISRKPAQNYTSYVWNVVLTQNARNAVTIVARSVAKECVYF